MAVVAFVSPKGGVGKTTAALLLAGEIADQGGKVRIIDADPNQPLQAWSEMPGRPDNISVVSCRSENDIGDLIEEGEDEANFVLVDLEGAATATVTFAIGMADLVIIPCKGSHLDAQQAARAILLVRGAARSSRRTIDHAILFTQIPPALRSLNYSDIEAQFADNEVPVLPVPVFNREAYRTMFSTGGTLHTLDVKGVGNIKAAKENSAAYAAAVIERLRQQNAEQKAA